MFVSDEVRIKLKRHYPAHDGDWAPGENFHE